MSRSTPEPFEVAIASEVIDDLKRRLRETRWPVVTGDDDWRYGPPVQWLQEMASYWANEYSWTDTAAAMNRYDHFQVELPSPVGGEPIPVHWLSAPARSDDAPALICTHGWPWTFWDMRKIIEPLRDHFHVIVPSLPGFGFSTPLATAGLDVGAVADLWVTLMTDVLGHDRFCAYGGDWGSLVSAQLGHAHPDRVHGVYMSLPVVPGVSRRALEGRWADDEQWMLDRMAEAEPNIRVHLGAHTRHPQTLAFGLADSPIGTAAWLWERRRNWSDCGGDVESVFDRDELCTLATLYWATGAISSSLRLYHEHFSKAWPLVHDRARVIDAPAGYAVFGKELVFLPRSVVEETTNLHRWSVFADGGGHFAPAERPEIIADELIAFFGPLVDD